MALELALSNPPPTSSCCCSPSFCFSQKQRQREARLRLPLSLTAMCAALDVCVSLHMSETWKSNRFSVSHCPKPFFSLSPFVSAFVLFAKSPLFFQSKSQVRVDDIFSFFSLFLCLMVICLLCIGQEVERHRVKKKKRDIQHQEDNKVVLQMFVTRRVTQNNS